MKLKMTPGPGWKLEACPKEGHDLLMQVIDERKGAAWYDLRDGAAQMSPYGQRAEGSSCAVLKKSQLIFLGETGIERLQWDSGSITTVAPIDLDYTDIWQLAASLDGEELYFIARQRAVPLSRSLEMTTTSFCTGFPWRVFHLNLDGTSSAPKLCDEVPANISPLVFSLDSMALIGLADGRDLVKLSLAGGGWQPISRVDRTAEGIAPAPQGGMFLWGFPDDVDSGIFLFDSAGKETFRISEAGYNPSASPSGGEIGFLTDAGIWLTQVGSRPSPVHRIDPVPSMRMGGAHRRIAWCDCGNHFAVTVDASDMGGMAPWKLLVADVREKKLFLYPYSPIDFQWKDCQHN